MCAGERGCGHHGHHDRGECGCREHGLRIEGFMIPCLLLLLKESPSHGYELMEKLSNLRFLDAVPDPGVVYRHLRCLEEDGMVESRLEPGIGGPARKVYTLTADGETYLEGWIPVIRGKRDSLTGFLTAFEQK